MTQSLKEPHSQSESLSLIPSPELPYLLFANLPVGESGIKATLQSVTCCMCMLHTHTHAHIYFKPHTEKSKISASAATEVSPSDEAKRASRELKNLKIDMACKSTVPCKQIDSKKRCGQCV